MKRNDSGSERDRANIEDSTPTRRGVLKGIGTTTAFGAAISGIPSALADSSSISEFADRVELSDEKTEEKVEEAIDSDVLETVFDEIPGGKNRVKTRSAKAYKITVSTTSDKTDVEEAVYTQIIFPVPGGETDLGYAVERDSGTKSAGVELKSGEVIRARSDSDGDARSVEREPQDEYKSTALQAVKETEEYDEYVADHPNYEFLEEDAVVSAFENPDKYRLHIPVIDVESDDAGPDRIITAELKKNSDDVVRIQASAWDCWVNCVALRSAGFWGFCYAVGCRVCVADPSRVTCVACAACVGVVGGSCALTCGVEQLL